MNDFGRYEYKIKRQAEEIKKLKMERDEGLREIKKAYEGIIAALIIRLGGEEFEISLDEIGEAMKADIEIKRKKRRFKITVKNNE